MADEEHHNVCKTCWGGQDNIVGRKCQGCIDHNEYEPLDKVKRENMVRKHFKLMEQNNDK